MSKVRLAWVLMSFGLIIVLVTLGFALYHQRVESINSAPLPNTLGDLSINSRILGRSALDDLSRLHGQEFQLNKGAVGIYGEKGEMTLYVAGTPLNFMAGRLMVAMRDKIARSETPFTPIVEREHRGRAVY